jgi:hypothetical protein
MRLNEIAFLPLYPPLMLSFSVRSVFYQRKVVLPGTTKPFGLWCHLGGVVWSNTPKVLKSWASARNRDWQV